MELRLMHVYFDSFGAETLVLAGDNHFRLVESDGSFLLPDVVVDAPDDGYVRRADAHIREVSGASPTLEHALRLGWKPNRRGMFEVRGRDHRVTHARTVPASALTGSRSDELTVEVTWEFSWRADGGRTGTAAGRVTLSFLGVEAEAPDPEPFPGGLTLRRQRPGVRSLGTLAVDFGTTSSTVTLHDASLITVRAMDPAQSLHLQRSLAALLSAGPPVHDNTEAVAEWAQAVDRIGPAVARRMPELYPLTTSMVVDRLQAHRSETTRLLDETILALDHALVTASPLLRGWLSNEIHTSYDEAFDVPALETSSLHRVELNGIRDYEVGSVLQIRTSPLTFTLDAVQPSSLGAQRDVTVFRGVKRYLGRSQVVESVNDETGRPVTTDDLLAHAYLQLVQRTEAFATRRGGELRQAETVIVTYPTTTPPTTRALLYDLVKRSLGLPRVVMTYDEGVAAAFFFIMRDFGGDRAAGVEALRSRSREVPGPSPSWRQNMLVIDIGGGTTDVALVALRLSDRTGHVDQPFFAGRYYKLEPQVLGSTGHPQLGGDYLTLRVLYWLKSSIVDELLRGAWRTGNTAVVGEMPAQFRESSGQPRPMAPATAAHRLKEPVPPDVREVLRSLFPTHRSAGAERAFQLLWEQAENAKIRLANGAPFELKKEAVREIFAAIPDHTRPDPALIGEDVVLDPTDFARLARPVIQRAVSLAADLVRARLGTEPGEQLDRVVLSGKTSMMPLVREIVVIELGRGEPGHANDITWNAAAVTVEVEYAKQAASLGACWADSLSDYVAGEHRSASELAEGRTQVGVSVNNLFLSLPCSFELKRLDSDKTEILAAGTPFMTDPDGKQVARSAWLPLLPSFDVHRPVDTADSIEWGRFRYAVRAALENFDADDRIWGNAPGVDAAETVHAMLEVDQNLTPVLYLCRGTPHYLGDGRWREIADLLPRDHVDRRERQILSLPWPIQVDAGAGDDYRHEVFAATSDQYDPDRDPFDVWLVTPDDSESVAVPAMISSPLPPPDLNGGWSFRLLRPNGDPVDICYLQVDGAPPRSDQFFASLDALGRLRVHHGHPRFVIAHGMWEVQHRAGTVLRVEMDRGDQLWNPDWDPFTEDH